MQSPQAKFDRKALIVDDSRAITLLLLNQIRDVAGIPVENAVSMQETEQLLQRDADSFFVAVLDLNLPDAPGGQVVDLVQRYGIPVIVLTGNLDDRIRQQMLRRLVVDYVLKRNASEIKYVANLVRLMRDNHQRKVLVVDDANSFRHYLKRLLEVHRYQLLEARNGEEALELVQANPDLHLILVDYQMPGMDGAELIERIRRQHGREEIAVIGMSSPNDSRLSPRLLKAGANDFIRKPFEVEEFYCRVTQNVEMICRIRRMRSAASLDFLTGVYNRRHFFELAQPLYANAKRGHYPIATAVIDADHFKPINDRFGHQAGDEVLVAIAGALKSNLRDSDLLGRYGGEEFVCLAVCADRQSALTCFERLRSAVEALRIPIGNDEVRVTVSVGATLEPCDSLEKMLAQADSALYQAKERGRNQVLLMEQPQQQGVAKGLADANEETGRQQAHAAPAGRHAQGVSNHRQPG